MRKKFGLIWLVIAISVIALQGSTKSRPGGSTGASTGGQTQVASSTTGTDAGSTTSTTADAPYDRTYSDPVLTVSSLKEILSANSFGYSGQSNKHALQAKYTHVGGGWATPNPNDPATTFASVTGDKIRTLSDGAIDVIYYDQLPSMNVILGGTPQYQGPGEDPHNRGSKVGDWRPRVTNWNVMVANGELGATGTPIAVPMTASTTANGVFAHGPIIVGSNVLFQFVSTAVLSAGTLNLVIQADNDMHVLTGITNIWLNTQDDVGHYHTAYCFTVYGWTRKHLFWNHRFDITSEKIFCDDLTADSRRGYGSGITNDEGKQVGDPNAGYTNYNFYTEKYKGGLFVGTMYWTTGDFSGQSVTQLYPQGSMVAATLLATLTTFYLGFPQSAPDGMDISVSKPLGTDPNINTAASAVTGATEWTQYQYPYTGTTTFGNITPNQYFNWTLPVATGAISKYGLFQTGTITGKQWRYFASSDYQALQTAFPGNDSKPRVWLLDRGASTKWSVGPQ